MTDKTMARFPAKGNPTPDDREETLSFNTDNDLLPLFPSPPDREQMLEREMTQILSAFRSGIRLSLRFTEKEKIQSFEIRVGDDDIPRMIVFDILARKISFPSEDVLFALIAIQVFGRALLGVWLVPRKRYCLKKMLLWCAAPPGEVYTISRVVFRGFTLGMVNREHTIHFQTGGSAWERFMEEYRSKKSGVIITRLCFMVRFNDESTRHFHVTERSLTGSRRDPRADEFELFLAAQGCVELSNANS